MKILVVCQYYYPEPMRVTDLSEELVKRGHEVTVLTGIPNYPEGKFYPGYENGQKREEIINGVRVYRCFTISRKKGSLHRLLNYYSYAVSSSIAVWKNKFKPSDGKDFDVIFVFQLSPVMMSYAAMVYKTIHHKRLVMYCLDLWPESLIAGGIKRNSVIYRIFYKISQQIYRYCDEILVTSRLFKDYLSKEFDIEEEKISYLPQYAESLFNEVKTVNGKETIDLVFAGNIGAVQSVETIINAAEILQEEKGLRIHIVGNGSDFERVKYLLKNKKIDNVILYGRKPVEEMPKYYAMADAMLVTLASDPLISLTLPGKVQSYMAAGKPIIGAIDGEASFVIKDSKCGYVCAAENSKMLAENIKAFMNLTKEERNQLGKNSRDYYKKYFDREMHMKNLEMHLENNKD